MKNRTANLDLRKIFKPVTGDIFDVINLYNQQSQKLIEALIIIDTLMRFGYVSDQYEESLNQLLDKYSIMEDVTEPIDPIIT
jgi:hypothetical protein